MTEVDSHKTQRTQRNGQALAVMTSRMDFSLQKTRKIHDIFLSDMNIDLKTAQSKHREESAVVRERVPVEIPVQALPQPGIQGFKVS